MKELEEIRKKKEKKVPLLGRTTGWFLRYRIPVLIGFSIFVIAGGGVLAFYLQKKTRSEKYAYEIHSIMEEYETLKAREINGENVEYSSLRNRLETLYSSTRGTSYYPIVLIYLYHVLLSQKNYDGALGVAQELREIARGNPRLFAVSLYLIGKSHEFKGDYPTARAFYRQAGEIASSPFGEFLLEETKRVSKPPLPYNLLRLYSTPSTPFAEPITTPREFVEIPIKKLLEEEENP
jgi:tetratricopeptide (TPR) repeat protein